MNKKGFTLIELLAVVIILGVVMMIAVPNVLSMLDRNKKTTFIEHAKTMITQAEYTLRKDTSIEYPANHQDMVIITLEYLNTDDIKESPYNTFYSPSKSFVAIVNNTENDVTEYQYYVHLVSCTDEGCTNQDDNSVNKNRGINLVESSALDSGNKFELVKEGIDVDIALGTLENDNTLSNEDKIKSELELPSTSVVKVFNKLS